MTLMLCYVFLYLQGFNRLVAIALLFMAEEDAFWCLVYVIESLMPPEYYSRDKQLIGAQVDQVSRYSYCLNHADNHEIFVWTLRQVSFAQYTERLAKFLKYVQY